jgi:hypothetical protein
VSFSNVLEAEPSLLMETKPRLDSYDSGRECSLEHLRELFRLLEVEDHELDGYVFDDFSLHVA